MTTAGDDLTGLADELGNVAEAAFGVEERPTEPLEGVGAAVMDDWAVRRIVWTMIPLLAALSVLQMISGTVLESFEETLLENPALLVLVPVQIGTAGNLASILCSRLSTEVHLGLFELSATDRSLRANVGAIFALAGTVFVVVGFAAWGIGRFLGGDLSLIQVLLIALISGLSLAVVVVMLSLAAVHASYRAGLNPDDITIPVVTNVCDISGVIILFVVVVLVV